MLIILWNFRRICQETVKDFRETLVLFYTHRVLFASRKFDLFFGKFVQQNPAQETPAPDFGLIYWVMYCLWIIRLQGNRLLLSGST